MGHKMCTNLKADVQVAGTCTLPLMSCRDEADRTDISNLFSGIAVIAKNRDFLHMNSRLERRQAESMHQCSLGEKKPLQEAFIFSRRAALRNCPQLRTDVSLLRVIETLL